MDDLINGVQTKTTFMLLRAEYAIALSVCVIAFLGHLGEIRWIPAVLLFAYIDVVGYLPGFITYRRAKNHEISRIYYVLYNTMHSLVTQSVITGLWIWIHGFEWALLVIPIHLCADRAIFGNFLKPFSLPFEPQSVPAFAEFQSRLIDARDESPVEDPVEEKAGPAVGIGGRR